MVFVNHKSSMFTGIYFHECKIPLTGIEGSLGVPFDHESRSSLTQMPDI